MKRLTYIALLLNGMVLSSCGSMGTIAQQQPETATQTQQQGNTAGGILGAILNGSANGGSVIGDIISTVAQGVTTNKNTIIGTWNYSRPSVQFESDNLLAQAGGAVLAEKVKNQLLTYYQKVGIKEGACKFVFNKDNTMQYTINNKAYSGTYQFHASNRTMTLTTQYGHNITAYVSIAQGAMGLTFDVSNLLKMIQNSGAASAQMGTLSTLAQNYKGMKLGFEFAK